MKHGKNLLYSVRALARSPWRTGLSASGMAIGIAAVVLLFGVGGGAERAFQEALETMGKNQLSITAEFIETSALRGSGLRHDTLRLGDWQAIAELPGVERTAPIVMSNYDLRSGSQVINATAIGTTPEFQFTNNQDLVAGRFIDADDLALHARVAVIGSQVVRDVFRGEQPLGERLLVGGQPFVVIGVLAEKGVDPTGAEQDNRVLVPVTTAQRRLLNSDIVGRIFVQAQSREGMADVQRAVAELLRLRHGLQTGEADDFVIRDQSSLLSTQSETDQALTRLLGGTAALALALGSMGLLAVTLLSVREREGEIGLRLAVGALPRQVLGQFLLEAVLVAALGGAAGLLVGGTGIILGEALIDFHLALTWKAVLYPFLISLVLSLVSGVYPAAQAARLQPIAALRRAR